MCAHMCVHAHVCACMHTCTCKYALALFWYQSLSVLAQRGPEARSSRYQDSRIVIVTEILVIHPSLPRTVVLITSGLLEAPALGLCYCQDGRNV